MPPPRLHSTREVVLYYDSIYDSWVESGQAAPFLYPWSGMGAFLVLGYLLVDHRQSLALKRLRYPIFVFLFAFQAWVIATNRARHPAGAFGVGLLSAWGVLWVSTLMVVNDCQTDFVRLERADDLGRENDSEPASNGGLSNGDLSQSTKAASKSDVPDPASSALHKTLRWQAYPDSVVQRLDWVADVFCSFRGVGWNWQTSTVPPLPKSQGPRVTTSKIGIRRFSNKTALLRETIVKLTIGYMALDVVKTTMTHDAYFWGYMDAVPPSYLPSLVQNSHILLKSYRLLLSLAGIYTALWEIFKLGPLFFCGILGPDWIGVRGEAWMNSPDMFGSFTCVLENGLVGWWGGWWHQVFRVAFEAHATRLLKALKIEKRSEKGKLISLFVAFFLSGCLHACGSTTQLGDTRPLMGPMRFFLLQPFGILLQMYGVRQLSKAGLLDRTPKFLRQVANFVFVHTWLYHVGPLLADDFAKGGVWLFEPVAISPLRGLGLGAKDDGWFCWWDGVFFWRSGIHCWDTGIAL